ncbi:Hypothetical protein ORPV_1053 [Orpheovirus IHUMI-LCC2]|uniref:Uncharacterized protein n=1 Tax=Orpheovirus IHUMI-LCC2 TaxID=2023057 RepID=A0A2I2L604_9VIRU|nr:Hypothetical protein ORPV_1053 [Orpheovirus IHUMI-LCC2]SNW62957.1 Hypothetical protein ORPV_1053 [Orpheovirus IHUMI-LCC2]
MASNAKFQYTVGNWVNNTALPGQGPASVNNSRKKLPTVFVQRFSTHTHQIPDMVIQERDRLQQSMLREKDNIINMLQQGKVDLQSQFINGKSELEGKFAAERDNVINMLQQGKAELQSQFFNGRAELEGNFIAERDNLLNMFTNGKVELQNTINTEKENVVNMYLNGRADLQNTFMSERDRVVNMFSSEKDNLVSMFSNGKSQLESQITDTRDSLQQQIDGLKSGQNNVSNGQNMVNPKLVQNVANGKYVMPSTAMSNTDGTVPYDYIDIEDGHRVWSYELSNNGSNINVNIPNNNNSTMQVNFYVNMDDVSGQEKSPVIFDIKLFGVNNGSNPVKIGQFKTSPKLLNLDNKWYTAELDIPQASKSYSSLLMFVSRSDNIQCPVYVTSVSL